MSSSATFRQGIYQSEFARKIARWLEAMPHPAMALEICHDRIVAARWSRIGGLDSYAVQELPPNSLMPSAVETNIANSMAVKSALASVMSQIGAKEEDVAMLLPDPVIRVFVQHFEQFPRSPQEAEPMLRWKLKKSVPFEADETVISYMRQAPREDGVDVVTALARLRIIREYEALAEGATLYPGVVLSSSLAAITLLDDRHPTLFARVSGVALTTAIVREGVLCGYRCTELPAQIGQLTPQMLLEEIYPVAAYYQDTWREGIQAVRVAGLGSRFNEFVGPMQDEFQCEVRSLLQTALDEGRVPEAARPLADHECEGLVGWMLHRN